MATAIVYRQVGGPEVLQFEEVPHPAPGAGEVGIAVRAAGVNPIDWKLRAGLRGDGRSGVRRLGIDAAGVVDAVGSEVEGVRVGDEVIVRGASGAYTTHLVVRAEQLVPKPAQLSFEQAAAIGVPAGTAYQALRSLGVGAGDTVLVHGGAGGVGQAAIQFARHLGAGVVATASERNHERLRTLGAIPVAYGPGLADRVVAAVPGGISAALDAIGTDEAIETSIALVADRDRIGTVVRGADATNWGIRAWAGGSAVPLTDVEQAWRAEATALAAELAAEGRFELEVTGRYRLEDAAAAHRESEAGHVRGKIVLVV